MFKFCVFGLRILTNKSKINEAAYSKTGVIFHNEQQFSEASNLKAKNSTLLPAFNLGVYCMKNRIDVKGIIFLERFECFC